MELLENITIVCKDNKTFSAMETSRQTMFAKKSSIRDNITGGKC